MMRLNGAETDWHEQEPEDGIVYRCMDNPRTLWSTGPMSLQLVESKHFIKILNPNIRCLSMLGKIICIIPKNRLRTVYNLIGEYLNVTGS